MVVPGGGTAGEQPGARGPRPPSPPPACPPRWPSGCASSGSGSVFFFSSRRRHTRFDCDWSSDVCSSDLTVESKTNFLRAVRDGAFTATTRPLHKGRTLIVLETVIEREDGKLAAKVTQTQIRRASC